MDVWVSTGILCYKYHVKGIGKFFCEAKMQLLIHTLYESCWGVIKWISVALLCKFYQINGVGGWMYGCQLGFCVKNIMWKALGHLFVGLNRHFVSHTLYERCWGMILLISTVFFCKIYHINGVGGWMYGCQLEFCVWHIMWKAQIKWKCWGICWKIKNALSFAIQCIKVVGVWLIGSQLHYFVRFIK